MPVGIDVGSRFLKVAQVSTGGDIVQTHYIPHEGRPLEALEKAFQALNVNGGDPVALTGSVAEAVAEVLSLPLTDLCKATIRGVMETRPDVRNIIDVGASSVTLIQLDEDGHLFDVATNTLCAAGTGSFLDAQAVRLGFELEDRHGFDPVLDPPSIATRCAVFAKSDLIHRQQEGYDKEALWCGLCKGLSSNILQTLLRGKPLEGLTIVTGGVAKNEEVLRWLKASTNTEVETLEGAEFAAAMGAAFLASENGYLGPIIFPSEGGRVTENHQEATRPPLELKKTIYPSFDVAESWVDDLGNEIRVTENNPDQAIRGYLGVDVGSTSTKAVLVDETGRVVVDVYRKTGGDPVGATKALFTALMESLTPRSTGITILGCGTTGSGRKMVGTLVGADSVVNEITAHLHGALATDPNVDTIFEIGGQDSKFIRARHGVMQDSNMNYVCAAGTGSFVEEQSLKLGHPVHEVGAMVMGVAPPHTSDRCTVFMEQDVERLSRQGFTPKEALAAVMYSVVENYLAKVVGNRSYSREKVFFCGATARNQGLVAAFEKLLDAEIVVSPYCHVLGAYGVALLTKERLEDTAEETTFKGLNLTEREISLTQEECSLCTNTCKITYAHISGEDQVPSWGYLCGRDPEDTEKRKTDEFDPFRLRSKLAASAFANHRVKGKKTGPSVGIPQTLSTYSHAPLWQTFMANLGCQIRLSHPTDESIRELSGALVGAEYCFPAKLAHGHVAQLAEDEGVDFVFMPHVVSEPVPEEYSNAFFCPVICALPAMARSSLRVAGRDGSEKILSPPVDFRWDLKRQVKELTKILGKPLGVSSRNIKKAWESGLAAQDLFMESCKGEGETLTATLESQDRPSIVFLGRPYNLFDGNANLELPLKVAEKGFDVFPADFVPIHTVELGAEFKNIYWIYGQRLLKALEWVRDQENVFPIWLTNFKCGPDSFLLTYAEQILGDKPFLILELDEHGGDAGYLTRIEAFLDVVRNRREKTVKKPPPLPDRTDPVEAFANRTIWVPPLHTIGAPLAAAAMRGEGLDGRALPLEDDESMSIGRQVTRGGECIPMTVTIGRLLQTLREKGGDGSTDAFFMPSACGPCRFGQYNLMERMVLEDEGFGKTAILAPNNDNAYQGLDEGLRRKIWTGALIGDLIFKVGCRFRPYSDDPASVDDMVSDATRIMEEAFESAAPLKPAFQNALAPFRALPKPAATKPLVGVVGEIFVRCNDFSNQNVVKDIEAHGGEAWLAPFHEWVLYAAWEHERRAKEGWDILGRTKSYVKNKYLFETEHIWHKEAGDLLSDRHEPSVDESAEAAYPYASFNYGGEVLLTIGRAVKFFDQGASLVVNCSPFGCMPGQVTTGILAEVQADRGKPVLNLFYDGTGDMNRIVGVFLRNLQAEAKTA